jgi:hypothetical protein
MNLIFRPDEYQSVPPVNTLFFTSIRVIDNAGNEMRLMKKAATPAILAAVTLLAVAVIGDAQQQTKVTKVGWLAGSGRLPRFDGYKNALRALGYIEGKNIAFEYRSAEGETGRFPALADELVRLKVDLIVANTTTAAIPLQMRGTETCLVCSVRECAEQIIRLMHNPEEGKALAKRSKTIVRERFVLTRMIADELRLYSSLLQNNSSL